MPAPFFNIDMLPARHGDCLWIEYGRGKRVRRILIDGGPVDTFPALREKIDAMPAGDKVLELVVLSHVDADHVEGLVRLFADKPLPFLPRQVWFNGWRQIARPADLGALQGEFLSALLVRRAPKAWRADGPAWVVPDDGPLPQYTLPGNMRLTLLSPDSKAMARMAKAWRKAITKFDPGDLEAAWAALAKQKKFHPTAGLLGGGPKLDTLLLSQFIQDQAAPNGSSIAFLAEFADKRALFLADAHPGVVCASIDRLCAERGIDRLEVDAVKVSHHGSKGNTSKALLDRIRSPTYLISSNGDQFQHPDAECIARIIAHGRPQHLHFNYRSPFTRPWVLKSAQEKYGYVAHVRDEEEPAARIAL